MVMSAEHRSPAMVTSIYDRKILERNVKPPKQTNNQTNKQTKTEKVRGDLYYSLILEMLKIRVIFLVKPC